MYGYAGSGVSGYVAQQCDDELLCAVPEFISLGGLLKATPASEGEDRVLYFEASNEDLDHQNEVILQRALAESAGYYLRHGNIDLSHYSILGPKSGIENFMEYEIGKPVDVRMEGPRTFVKALLYRGDSPMAKNADMVWKSLTAQSPPSRWYPSVGGSVLGKSIKLDPDTGAKVAVIDKVRWNNVALDRCPVNKTVPEVSTRAEGVFAKSLNGFVVKALQAGYGTDMGTLTGGAALGVQSLDRKIKQTIPGGYWDFRERLAGDIKTGRVKSMNARGLVSHVVGEYGVDESTAAEWVEAFLRGLQTNLKRKPQ
jgi:hypothetical protein